MRWQRPARYLMAVIGIGCAVAIGMYGRERRRPPAAETPAVLTDQNVSAERTGVLNLRTNFTKGHDELRIEAEKEVTYTDGRTRLDQAHFTSTRADGTTFEIWAGAAESQGKAVTGDEPGQMVLSKGVRTKSSDGLEVRTDAATYDNVQGLADIPGALTFTRERLTGGGVGGTYDRERDVLWLLDQAHVKRAPDEEGGGGLEASARQIGVARVERFMNLRDHATIVQPDQTLAADQIILHFTDDERGASLIEMHGAASVVPSGGGKTGAPDLRADDITLEFHDDGQTLRHAVLIGRARVVQINEQGRQTISAADIDLSTGADGRTLTNLNAKGGVEVLLPPGAGQPDRTIRAATLVTSGDEHVGLKAAIFEGGVTFIEKSAPAAPRAGGRGRGAAAPAPAGAAFDRTGTSASLALELNGQLGAIKTAEFRRDVKFKDGNLTAAADLAVHDQVNETLVLTPAAGAKTGPWVEDGSVRVDAMWIQVALETHDLQAKDRVKLKMAQGASADGTQAHTPALFDAGQPVYGTGMTLQYVSATREAKFTGQKTAPARVYQNDGTNWIQASDLVEVQQESGNLHAVGEVVSTFMLASDKTPVGATAPAGARGARAAAPAKKGAAAAAGPAAPAATPATVIRAQEMTYVDVDRKAVYVGEGALLATLQGPDANVAAHELVLFLQKDQRAMKTLQATGTMFARFEGGREAMGDRLVYDAATETHVITGKPMYFKNVQNEGASASCSLETSTELRYKGTSQTIEEPGSEAKALRSGRAVGCDKPLKALVPSPVPVK